MGFRSIVRRIHALSKKVRPRKVSQRRRILFEAMEKRLLLSADPVAASQELAESDELLPPPLPAVEDLDSQTAAPGETAADGSEPIDSTTPADGDGRPDGSDTSGEPTETDDAGDAHGDSDGSQIDSPNAEAADAGTSETGMAAAMDAPSDVPSLPPATQTSEIADPTGETGGDLSGEDDGGSLAESDVPVTSTAGVEIIFIDAAIPDASLLAETLDPPPEQLPSVEPETDEPAPLEAEADSADGLEVDEEDSEAPPVPYAGGDPSPVPQADVTVHDADPATGPEPQREIVTLDAGRDGIEQISEKLARYADVRAVHILSHGSEGALRLGSTLLDHAGLEQHAESVRGWQAALSPGGDILLYGCDVASGGAGIAFVERMSELTGADVAASTDDTGGELLGGDWELEYQTGYIETLPLFHGSTLTDYTHLLDNITGTAGNDTLTGEADEDETLIGGLGDDTYRFQDDWGTDMVTENGGEGTDTLDFSDVTADLTFSFHPEGTVSVTDGDNQVSGAANIEKIIGGSGANVFNANGLSDDLRFTYLADGRVILEDDTATIVTATGMDQFVGGEGRDSFDFSALTQPLEFIIQGDGVVKVTDDTTPIAELSNIDDLVGGAGDDRFRFEDDAFVMGRIDGGGGSNTLDYSAYTSSVRVDLTLGEATGTTRIAGIRNVIGGSADDHFTGDNRSNTFTGTGGRDTYVLGADWRSDTFVETADGDGWDTLDFSNLSGGFGFTVDADGRIAVDAAGVPLKDFTNFELVVGSAGDDIFRFMDDWGNVGVIENPGNGTDILDLTAVTDNFQFNIDQSHFAMESLSLTFGTGHITRSIGSWADEGFAAGQSITVDGDSAVATDNSGDYTIAAISTDGRTLVLEEDSMTVETGVEGLSVTSAAASLGSLTLDFAGDSVIRSMGSWIEDGFEAGQTITVVDNAAGDTDNAGEYEIYSVTDATLTLTSGTNLIAENGLAGIAVKARVAGVFVVETGEEDDHFSRLEFVDNVEHILGGSGDDTFYFKEGAVLPGSIDSGSGNNTLNYSEVTANITVNLTTGDAFGTTQATGFSNVYGGMGADTLTGNADANVILGGDKGDVITGLGGDDLLSGGEGDDLLEGGAGSDEIVGGAGTDRVSYANDEAGVTVNLAQFTATDGFVVDTVEGVDVYGTDSLDEIENILGSGFDDDLVGDTYKNRILGGAGDDILNGGTGNDVLDGGAGSDTVNYAFENTGVTADLSKGTATDGTGNRDTLAGIENLIGSEQDDTLIGSDDNNVLSGLTGNDTLSGGAGDDTYRFGDDWGSDTLSDDNGANTLDFSETTVDLNFTIHPDGSLSVDDSDGAWRHLTFIPESSLALISDASTLDDAFTFSHLVGGGGDNTFIFEDTAAFDGTIDGGTGGTNTLDYSEYEADVAVDLDNGTATGTTGVDNIHAVVSGKGVLQMIGSAANETISFVNSAEGVIKDLGSMVGIENITGTVNDDHLSGDGWYNILDGRGGDDVLEGGAVSIFTSSRTAGVPIPSWKMPTTDGIPSISPGSRRTSPSPSMTATVRFR